jgi:hypothetical protein
MGERTGEKIGWLGGWTGAFLWAAVLGVVFLARGRWLAGTGGIALAALGLGLVFLARPWRHPRTPFWKLMLAPMAIIAATIPWAILSFGSEALREEGVNAWNLLPLVAVFVVPFATMGRRRWSDGEGRR